MRKRLVISLTITLASLAGVACDLSTTGTLELHGSIEDAGQSDASLPPALSDSGADTEDAGDADFEADDDADDTGEDSYDSTPPPLPVVARLNINGPDYKGIDYPGNWKASPVPGICGPNSFQTPNPIHGTHDGPLFMGEAYGNPATCTVGNGLARGTYRVRLYFAEIYWGDGCTGPGGGPTTRVFDIVLEGETVLRNLDILAESGGCIASTTSDAGVPIVKSFDVLVTDGTLDIALPASSNNGKISALEVLGPL